MKTIIALVASSFILASAPATSALADESHNCGSTSGKMISKDAAKNIVANMGYSVRRVKKEGGCYEVKALGKQGQRVEFLMNPVSGKIIGREHSE